MKTWLPLLRDQNQQIRENLARSIGTILKNKIAFLDKMKKLRPSEDERDELVEFVNSICNFMAETLENALEIPDDSLHCSLITTATEFGRYLCRILKRKIEHTNGCTFRFQKFKQFPVTLPFLVYNYSTKKSRLL